MKVCVTASQEGLDAPLDDRFGRAPYFVIVDTDTLETATIVNHAIDESHGAGVSSATAVAQSGAEALITAHCGPRAFDVLDAAGIKVFAAKPGTVRNAVEAFNNGALTQLSGADAPAGGLRR